MTNERRNAIVRLRVIFEEILSNNNIKIYLSNTDEIDRLYEFLESLSANPYSDLELELLKELLVLNENVKLLTIREMDRMEKTHMLSPKISQKYDVFEYGESYFFDKKH
ncbi:hypothetical protein [Paenibacillus sp. GbtcB18]|uniref:hypothetical protein n=1 Tax=Paenibacillus sp. GbtcB18 TaxID=2824763 RepID=UPI001C30A92B|nr:hypothetical protein [Paenibacillus sp. GbtcB18]